MRIAARIAVLALAAAGSAWALWHWCWLPHRCNAELTSIQASTNAIDSLRGLYAREQRANGNLARLAALRATCATDVRVPFLTGVNESLAGRHERAVAALEEALTLDPRPEIYVALGQEQVFTGRNQAALESYLTAARFGFAIDEHSVSEEILRQVRERLHER
jgi:tetratricopeptide (TPR) repeat protein